MSRSVLCALALVAAWPAASRAQTPAAACDVVVASHTGGQIEVRPGQIVWAPSRSGSGVMLLISYPAGDLTRMSEPSALAIRFTIIASLAPDATSVVVKAPNGRSWRFEGPAIAFGKDNQASVSFGLDWPYGRGLLASIANNQPLAISVQQDGRELASESFVLSNMDARDTLLSQARAKFAAADPKACS